MNKNEKMNENDVQNEKYWLKAVNVQSIDKTAYSIRRSNGTI